jgi:hypothetical protein
MRLPLVRLPVKLDISFLAIADDNRLRTKKKVVKELEIDSIL